MLEALPVAWQEVIHLFLRVEFSARVITLVVIGGGMGGCVSVCLSDEYWCKVSRRKEEVRKRVLYVKEQPSVRMGFRVSGNHTCSLPCNILNIPKREGEAVSVHTVNICPEEQTVQSSPVTCAR